jgi:hypothetical protein
VFVIDQCLPQKGDFSGKTSRFLSLFWQFGKKSLKKIGETFYFVKCTQNDSKVVMLCWYIIWCAHFWLAFVPKWGIFKLLGDYRYLSIMKPQIIDNKIQYQTANTK